MRIEMAAKRNGFGSFLRKRREQLGYSLRDFSKKTGCSISYLWKLESGGYEPGLRKAARIAKVYGFTLNFLAQRLGPRG
jgi:transcriptional regulator with XRE-family HTH domain